MKSVGKAVLDKIDAMPEKQWEQIWEKHQDVREKKRCHHAMMECYDIGNLKLIL